MMTKEEIRTNEVTVYTCNTWDEFIKKVRKQRFAAFRIFRGHAQLEWKLSSHLERLINRMKSYKPDKKISDLFSCPGGYKMLCNDYLSRFKKLAVGTPGLDTRDWKDID